VTRSDLESDLEILVTETVSLPKKDRDRLIDSLADYMVDELYLEVSEEEEEEEEET